MRALVAAAAGAVATAALIGGVSLAVGTSEPLYACVTNRTGAVRMVAAATGCNARTERKITWNVEGPQGPAGAPGASAPRWSLLDANGMYLGEVFSHAGAAAGQLETIFVNLDGKWVAYENGYRVGVPVYWETQDCTGVPLVEPVQPDMSWIARTTVRYVRASAGEREILAYGDPLTDATFIGSMGSGVDDCQLYGQQLYGLAPVTLGDPQAPPVLPLQVVPAGD